MKDENRYIVGFVGLGIAFLGLGTGIIFKDVLNTELILGITVMMIQMLAGAVITYLFVFKNIPVGYEPRSEGAGGAIKT